eukprot:Nk52_evm79s485 gene=Nk52_evmTU79s485
MGASSWKGTHMCSFPLLFLLFVVLALQIQASPVVYPFPMKWAFTLEEQDGNYTSTQFIVPNTNYFLRVFVECSGTVNPGVDTACANPSLTAAVAGVIPKLSLLESEAIVASSFNNSWEIKAESNAAEAFNGDWHIPFTSGNSSLAFLELDTGGKGAYSVFRKRIMLAVDGFTKRVSNGVYESFIGSNISSFSSPIKQFDIYGSRGVSTSVLVIVNDAANEVLITNNVFEGYSYINVGTSFAQSSTQCPNGDARNTGIKKGIFFQHILILQVPQGIIELLSPYQPGNATVGTSLDWKVLVSGCVEDLFWDSQYSITSRRNVFVTMKDWSIFVSNVNGEYAHSEFVTLMDSNNKTLKDFATDLPTNTDSDDVRILDARTSPANENIFIFLLDLGATYASSASSLGRYRIYHFVNNTAFNSSLPMEWKLVYIFPKTVPHISDPAKSIPAGLSIPSADTGLVATADTTASISVSLSGFSKPSIPNADVYFFGNCLFLSRNDGYQIYLLKTWSSSETITKVVSYDSGALAIHTSTNELWYSESGSLRLIQIVKSRATGTLFAANYDPDGFLFEITAPKDTAPKLTTTVYDIQEIVDRTLAINGEECPFSSVHFTADQSVGYTRNTIPAVADFPEVIYLDKWEKYSFQIDYQPKILAYSTDPVRKQFVNNPVNAYVIVSDVKTVNASVTRTIDYVNETYKYFVELQDTGRTVRQELSNELNTVVGVMVETEGSNMACKNEYAEAIENAQARYMWIASGCAPGKHVDFDETSTTKFESQGCSTTEFPPCLYYENDFKPEFNLVDSKANSETLYTGLYTLKIVAGGPTLEDIAEYSETEKAIYNPPGTKAIWTAISSSGDIPVFNGTINSGLNWLCAPGSPCEGVKPKFPNTPEYFFIMEFSNIGVMEDQTYCNYTTRFTVRVHGLPMDFLTVMAIVLSVMGGLFAFVIFGYFYMSYRERQTRLHPPKPKEEPEIENFSVQGFARRKSKDVSDLLKKSISKISLRRRSKVSMSPSVDSKTSEE